MRLLVFGLLLAACMAQFPPVVIRVWNAAGLSANVPYRAIVPGSLIIVQGVPNPVDPNPLRYTVKVLPQTGGAFRAQVLRTTPDLLALLPRSRITWAADGYAEADVVIGTVSSISYLDSSNEQPASPHSGGGTG